MIVRDDTFLIFSFESCILADCRAELITMNLLQHCWEIIPAISTEPFELNATGSPKFTQPHAIYRLPTIEFGGGAGVVFNPDP